ncbi:lipopolysaccharide assembly protein LapA domain-containing protein [Azospira restricta]|uniref:LapA family protein n=1 Tax=Azospira restricta TaxID=404405 RepID=A0A974PV70_9RHOO|nr:LapA family protein [Azospira restricta]QRJ62147.1 LapA family protein [Azospira restricta]
MRTLVWVVRGFIFLFLFAFAIKNTDPVTLRFFLDTAWQAPLVIVVLAFFAAGAFFGAVSLLGTIFSLRRELAGVRRELSAVRSEARVVAPPQV